MVLTERCVFVSSYHFEVQHSLSDDGTQSDRIQYTHVMSRGRTNEKHYGQSVFQTCSAHSLYNWFVYSGCCYTILIKDILHSKLPLDFVAGLKVLFVK